MQLLVSIASALLLLTITFTNIFSPDFRIFLLKTICFCRVCAFSSKYMCYVATTVPMGAQFEVMLTFFS